MYRYRVRYFKNCLCGSGTFQLIIAPFSVKNINFFVNRLMESSKRLRPFGMYQGGITDMYLAGFMNVASCRRCNDRRGTTSTNIRRFGVVEYATRSSTASCLTMSTANFSGCVILVTGTTWTDRSIMTPYKNRDQIKTAQVYVLVLPYPET